MNTPNLHALLSYAKKMRASDLHLSAGDCVRLRIDGKITTINATLLGDEQVQALVRECVPDDKFEQLKAQRELDFSFEIKELSRFRANIFYQNRGMSAVFRLINSTAPTLDDISDKAIFRQLCTLKQGLVLVTGATGSGKSTTLAAMIDHINRTQSMHILTIEDPIEFVHTPKQSLINQREIHKDTHDFEHALRSALREDPDVILVGELRDLPSIRLALQAAETGHLVFATLHTNSATKAIDRLIDVFDANEKAMIRTMLSESLQAVIAQRLLPKTQGGRVAAFEIMTATPAIRNLIRENKVAQMSSIIQTGADDGMISLENHLKQLVGEQLITAEVAKEHLSGVGNFSSLGNTI